MFLARFAPRGSLQREEAKFPSERAVSGTALARKSVPEGGKGWTGLGVNRCCCCSSNSTHLPQGILMEMKSFAEGQLESQVSDRKMTG